MTDDIIDQSALKRLLEVIGGDPDDFDELLQDYQSAAPELAARISGAADAGNLETLRIAAHTLKSNAREFGALRLSQLCERLEHECRTGIVSDPKGIATSIVAEEETARRALASLPLGELSR